MENNSKSRILEGIISIRSAILSGKREIIEVLADKKKVISRDRKATQFISFLKQNDVKYTLLDRQAIDEIAYKFSQSGSTHGGFLAYVKERTFEEFSLFLDNLTSSNNYAVYLDGVEDPFNFGYSIRNLYAFGAYGIIMPQRNWMTSANVVARASAGASELCEITIAPSDEEALALIREKNIKIVCAGLCSDSVSLYNFELNEPFILFIGGEKRGISNLFFENADMVVSIPYTNENVSYSLPTASVASIFGSHIAMSKNNKN